MNFKIKSIHWEHWNVSSTEHSNLIAHCNKKKILFTKINWFVIEKCWNQLYLIKDYLYIHTYERHQIVYIKCRVFLNKMNRIKSIEKFIYIQKKFLIYIRVLLSKNWKW